jgi:hypothetical protein
MRELHLDVTITPLTFADFRLSPPALGDIHIGAGEFDDIAGSVGYGMTYLVNVLD